MGRGVQPQFIVKLVFEIAVDQQKRTSDLTFEVVPDPNRSLVPVVNHNHIWFIFGPLMKNHRNMPETHILDAVLVSISLLNSYINFHPNWTKIG